MTQLVIRPAPASLLPQIQTAIRATWEEHRARQPHAFAKGELEAYVLPGVAQAFQDQHGRPVAHSDRIFAAYLSDTFAGYVMLSRLTLPDGAPVPFVNIEDIHVQPQFRGQGVGRALLDHVKDMSEMQDWDNVTATVWQGNDTSAALFDKAGFAPISTTLRFGPDRQVRDQLPPAATPRPEKQRLGDLILAVLVMLLIIGMLASVFGS